MPPNSSPACGARNQCAQSNQSPRPPPAKAEVTRYPTICSNIFVPLDLRHLNRAWGMSAGDYKYDFFISYRRADPVRLWVRNHFFPQLQMWMRESFPTGREASIFIDNK